MAIERLTAAEVTLKVNRNNLVQRRTYAFLQAHY